jgi:threonine dehydrogenase-like Zn-dependent dehydrogenase
VLERLLEPGWRLSKHGFKAIGGWKFGNTIDGCQAEYVLVPDAMVNLAPCRTS